MADSFYAPNGASWAEYNAGRTGNINDGKAGWQSWGHRDTYYRQLNSAASQHNAWVVANPPKGTDYKPPYHEVELSVDGDY